MLRRVMFAKILFAPHFSRLETYGLTFTVWLAMATQRLEPMALAIPIALASYVWERRAKSRSSKYRSPASRNSVQSAPLV